jgi:pimeloyl-ACP methyl ester carboxylesterase
LYLLNIREAILIGHSAGGTVVMNVALRHPDRVAALVLVDPAIYTSGGAPGWIRPLLGTPQLRRIGPLIARLDLADTHVIWYITGRADRIIPRTAWRS